MLNTSGLSLANTPPYSVPLGFFLMAPLFALVAGVLLMTAPEYALTSRWTPTVLATTHLLVLGFITSIMCGSLLQILPVLIGTRRVVTARTAGTMVVMLGGGTALLSAGLLLTHGPLSWVGAALCVGMLPAFAFEVIRALAASSGLRRIRWSVALAVFALIVTVFMGAMLIGSRSGWPASGVGKSWTDVHLAWGLAGWMGLLLIGVAGELLPMFYLSPPPAQWLMRALPWAITGLLLSLSWMAWIGEAVALPVVLPIGLLLSFGGFAIAGFVSQLKRRRPRRDPTLGFWWLGQASILLAAVAWLMQAPVVLTGVLLIVGAGMSFTCGTLFKIVPFLSWYHLQATKVKRRRTDVKLPTMQGFIGDTVAHWQLAIHTAATALLAIGAWWHAPTVWTGGLLLAGSALLLWYALLRAAWRYRRIARTLTRAA